MSVRSKNLARKWLALTMIFGLLLPQTGYAAGLPVIDIVNNTATQIWRFIKPIILNVATVAVVNIGQQLARDAAESTAQWIASGGKGKSPLSYMKSSSDYIADAKNQALGEAIGSLSERLGLNDMLCRPTIPGIASLLPAVAMQVTMPTLPKVGGVAAAGGQVPVKCDFQVIMSNYEELAASVSPSDFLAQFSKAMDAGSSEVGLMLATQINTFGDLVKAERQARLDRESGNWVRPVADPISGKVNYAPDLVKYEAESATARAADERQQAVMTGLLASGAEAMPSIFASTLFNSLSKKLLAKLKKGTSILSDSKDGVNLSDVFGSSAGSNANGFLSDTRVVAVQSSDMDLLTQFETCPEQFAGTDNCVLDSGFAGAIRMAKTGKALTVRQAIESGQLNSGFEFVSSENKAVNEDRLCFKKAFCYSNLVKLRRARVIPMGWEMAAELAGKQSGVTLKKVMENFNSCQRSCSQDANKACVSDKDCGLGNTCLAERNANFPYCHLIDPNWILKMPDTMCRALVYGAVLENQSTPNRKQECADQPSCIAEGPQGECLGGYGYCLKEKNVWRMGADTCNAQYAGCRTFKNSTAGEISLLESTVDAEICTEKNSGCRKYYTDFTTAGAFATQAPPIYLNAQAANCEAKNAGCTEVQDGDTGAVSYLRLPPASLGCTGSVNDAAECAKYAAMCTADEVGCTLYQPTNGDPNVPGIITPAARDASGAVVAWNNECAAECVGYASYYQQPTALEPQGSKLLAFIPATATQCSSEAVGCAQFVNIDEATKGGGTTEFYSEVKKCARPQDRNHAVFYTWEGSDTTGYQLKTHDLVVDVAGLPIYDTKPAVGENCDATIFKNRQTDPNYTVDCREMFNKQGQAVYRLLSYTLESSPECVLMRKENSDEGNCQASGGTFAEGACTYSVLPAASRTCAEEFVGCRAYSGVAAANSRIIFTENFVGLGNWIGGELSKEGITVGDTVWRLPVGVNKTSAGLTFAAGKSYKVVFWGKGQGAVNVSLNNAVSAVTINAAPIKLSSEWRRFELNTKPMEFSGGNLTFTKTDNTALTFLDNIVVRAEQDAVYVVRNSWQTPATCDPNLDDNFPGPALNCQEYQYGQADKKIYLTDFLSVCRDTSAGCARFVNTYNTSEIAARVVKLNKDGSQEKEIPADEYVYVVANDAAYCTADKRGCSALGVDSTSGVETVFKINNPDAYETNACLAEEDRCDTFTANDGQQRYFKYPDTAHQCEYREAVELVATKQIVSGWFKQGTEEPCYSTFIVGGNTYGIYKNDDGAFAAVDGGMAGLCPKSMNQCTEFVDHMDVSTKYPAGKPYYLLKNERLDTASCNGKVSLKEGCVLLEDRTRSAENNYSSILSYCKSDPTADPQCVNLLFSKLISAGEVASDGALVSPVIAPLFSSPEKVGVDCRNAALVGLTSDSSCTAKLAYLKKAEGPWLGEIDQLKCPADNQPNDLEIINALALEYVKVACSNFADANTIVRVQRDRECGEWLACKSNGSVKDPTTGNYREICNQIGVCNQYAAEAGSVGGCANWVTTNYQTNLESGIPLSTAKYVRRNVGWFGREYSGYSLWNKFQPQQMSWFELTANNTTEKVLGVPFVEAGNVCDSAGTNGKACIASLFGSYDPVTKKNVPAPAVVKDFPDSPSYEGRCYDHQCWYSIDAFASKPSETAISTTDFVSLSCRAYPEIDAPFPTSVVSSYNLLGQPAQKSAVFKGANVCEKYSSILLRHTPETWTTKDAFAKIIGEDPTVKENGSCECSYVKAEYGETGPTMYLQANVKASVGVCDGGWFVYGNKDHTSGLAGQEITKKGLACTSDLDCIDERIKNISLSKDASGPGIQEPAGEDGRCVFKKSEINFFGWRGYCLENDLRARINNTENQYACLTWLPLDVGDVDVYNFYTAAGFSPEKLGGAGKYYCARSSGFLNTQAKSAQKNVVEIFSTSNINILLDSKGNTIYHKSTIDDLINKYSDASKDLSGVFQGGLDKAMIDYIELEAVGGGAFFPDGYKVRVAEDGKVRFYLNNLWVSSQAGTDAAKNSCPGSAGGQNSGGPKANYVNWDIMDPTTMVGVDQVTNSTVLSKLSLLARCYKSADKIVCPRGYFSNTGTDDIKNYFQCTTGEAGSPQNAYPGEFSEKDPTLARELAVTGAVLYPGDETAPLQEFGSAWYVRINNQLNNQTGGGAYMMWQDIVRQGYNIEVPKLGSCAMEGEEWKKGYQLRFLFDNKEKLKWIDTALCNSNGSNSVRVNWKIRIYLRNMCTMVLDTQVPHPSGEKRIYAYTNNLWLAPNKVYGSNSPGVLLAGKAGKAVARVSDYHAPFGSFVSSYGPEEKPGARAGWFTSSTPNSFQNLLVGAGPYSCDNADCRVDNNGNLVGPITLQTGESLIRDNLFAFWKNEIVRNSYQVSLGLLGDNATNDWTVYENKTTDYDARSSVTALANHPVIASFDPSDCSAPGKCRLKKLNAMTVNGEFQDGAVVAGKGSLSAKLQFYGWADHNHMPIRTVTIDWGDGTPVDGGQPGMYRNRKAVCSTTDKPAAHCTDAEGKMLLPNITCQADADCAVLNSEYSCDKKNLQWSFGDWVGVDASDGACQEGFFQFMHAYSYTDNCGGKGEPLLATPQLIEQYGAQGKLGVGERFCVFKPKVVLVDNWDICNKNGGGVSATIDSKQCKVDNNKDGKEPGDAFQGIILVKE